MNRKLVFAVLSIVCLAGMFVSTTLSVGVSDQPAYMVVRGSDNGIYYRLYNEGIGTWGAWTKLPGSTGDSPSAAYIGGQLCVVVRGIDEDSLWQGFINVDTGVFSGWTRLSGSSPSEPALGSASSPSGFESTGYISVSAGAFSTYFSTDVAYTGSAVLRNMDTKTVYFSAGVQLPQGAVITNVTSHWGDWDLPNNLECDLYRDSGGSSNVMAQVFSTGSAGGGSAVDTSINLATVDNSHYSYSLGVTIPAVSFPSNLEFYGVIIGYTYPT